MLKSRQYLKIALLSSACFTFAAQSIEITVDSGNDNTPSLIDGKCTLREAVALANARLLTNDCGEVTFAGTDTITFDGDYIIKLAGTEISITDTLIIDGEDHTITVNAQKQSRIFGSTAAITLKNMTLVNGKCGDGVTCDDLANEMDADGGAVASTNQIKLEGMQLFGNNANYGGAVSSYINTESENQNVVVRNSTLLGNSAANGGGAVYAHHNTTVINSTLAGNTANYGGAISTGNSATVSNSTLAGNHSANGGGAVGASNSATVSNSTLSGNTAESGGAIFAVDTVTVNSSILLGNSAIRGGQNCAAIVNSETITGQNNLFESGADCGNGATTTLAAVLETEVVNGNTVAKLADNGCATPAVGGCPETVKLRPNISNPAVNMGSATGYGENGLAMTLTADQRGFVFVGDPDIGAYEAQRLVQILADSFE